MFWLCYVNIIPEGNVPKRWEFTRQYATPKTESETTASIYNSFTNLFPETAV